VVLVYLKEILHNIRLGRLCQTTKTSGKMAGSPVEIRNGYLLDTSQERYRDTNLLGFVSRMG
jgi:hypothetical protein